MTGQEDSDWLLCVACRASKLFHAYDEDKSGSINASEFLAVLQALDPTLVMEDVRLTFDMVSATDSLNEDQFWQWCESVFGELEHAQYIAEIRDLVAVSIVA